MPFTATVCCSALWLCPLASLETLSLAWPVLLAPPPFVDFFVGFFCMQSRILWAMDTAAGGANVSDLCFGQLAL